MDIISEFNEKNEKKSPPPPPPPRTDKQLSVQTEPAGEDLHYLKWVSESQSGTNRVSSSSTTKLTPTESCSSGKSGSSYESEMSGERGRTSSPDSGCEVMVRYTKEPRVRRPDTSSDTDGGDSVLKPSAPVPVPAPRQSVRKSGGEERRRTVAVTNIDEVPVLSVKELESPCSRAGIYSLEGSRINCLADTETSEASELSDSGRGSSMLSQEETQARTLVNTFNNTAMLRSYASSRDILELYGHNNNNNSSNIPLTPRMVGFSSSDLRLPPAAMLMSLSGKKSNSALSIPWAPVQASPYQNVPQVTKKRISRDVVF